MASRNILNYQGTVIGQLTLPDDTPEEVWQKRLAEYAKPPKSQEEVAAEYLAATISERQVIAASIMDRLKARNIAEGINIFQALWVHHRLRALEVSFMGLDVTIDLMNLVISGDLESACISLMNCQPDDMSQSHHWLNSDRIGWLVSEIKAVLGW